MITSDAVDTPVPTAPAVRTAPPEATGRPQTRARRWVMPLIALVVLGAAGVFIWRTFFVVPPIPSSIVTLSGRIEGDDSAIAPKVDGKILEIRVQEGDTMQAGDVIAILDDSQIRAQEDQARAEVQTAEAQAQVARAQIGVLQQAAQQTELQTGQSVTDAQGRVRQAQADLATAQANLAQQQAAYKMAAFNEDAYTRLAQQGAVSEQQRIQAVTAAEQQAAAVTAAQRQVSSARGALTTAQANLANPAIHGAATAGVEQQMLQQQSTIASANSQVVQAQAQLAEAEANRQDLIIRAPFSGTVTTRAAEPGEVVTAGTAIVTLLNLHEVYLRGFVPEGDIGKVKLGQPAHIYLDSNTSHPIDAYILRIDPEATFTPENTYFREDRVTQVFGVDLGLKSGFGYAKPGMPADGEILVSGTAWPAGWKGWHSQ